MNRYFLNAQYNIMRFFLPEELLHPQFFVEEFSNNLIRIRQNMHNFSLLYTMILKWLTGFSGRKSKP